MHISSLHRRVRRFILYRMSWSAKSFAIAVMFWFLHFALYHALSLEPSLVDLWFAIRGSIEPPQEVILVNVTEQTFEALHQPLRDPITRKTLAGVLERIAALGAKLIIFDMVFSGTTTEEEDSRFEDALRKAPTIIGTYPIPSSSNADDIVNITIPQRFIANSRGRFSTLLPFDRDGYVRRMTMPNEEQSGYGVASSLWLAGYRQLRLPDSRALIRYYGSSGTIHAIDAKEFLSSDRAEKYRERIQGKVVVFGFRINSSRLDQPVDAFRTPVPGTIMYGAEIHATVAANMIEQSWIHRLSFEAEQLVMSIASFGTAFLILGMPPSTGGAALLLVIGLWGLGSYLAFLAGWFLPGVTLLCVLAPILYCFNSAYAYSVLRTRVRDLQEILGVSLDLKK